MAAWKPSCSSPRRWPTSMQRDAGAASGGYRRSHLDHTGKGARFHPLRGGHLHRSYDPTSAKLGAWNRVELERREDGGLRRFGGEEAMRPSASPPSACGLVRVSPSVAPRGRVRTYVDQHSLSSIGKVAALAAACEHCLDHQENSISLPSPPHPRFARLTHRTHF